jgi:8-oxo-dGTP diphosphatase
MKTLEVVAGILYHEGQVLCVQRGKAKFDYIAYKYEFPGGKIEPGETPEAALVRELQEELHKTVKVKPEQLFTEVTHKYADFAVHVCFYLCPVKDRTLKDSEHMTITWTWPQDIEKLDWVDADKEIVKKVAEIK